MQFSSLHNKQQHCLSRRHNEEVVKFVTKSIRSRRKNSQGENNKSHKTDNVVCHGSSSSNQNTGHCANNSDHVSIAKDHVSNAEDQVSNTKDHVSNAEDQVSNTTEHVSNVKDQVNNNNEDHVNNNNEDHVITVEDHVITVKDHVIATKDHVAHMEHSNINTQQDINYASNSIANHEDAPLNVVDLTHDMDHTGDHTTGGISMLNFSTHVGHGTINDIDNHGTSSAQQSTIMDKSLDGASISFPPHCSIGHVIHDFTLHQQGNCC